MVLGVRQCRMRTGFGGRPVRFEARRAASTDHYPPLPVHNEGRDGLLNCCFKRICGWRAPPNWSVADWREEIRAHGLAAAYEASCEFDPSRGVSLDAFIYCRVIARAYTRFRQEWAYGLRCIPETYEAVTDGGCVSLPSESRVQCRESSVVPNPVYQSLKEALGSLSESSRRLIMQLFWEEQTEANIAQALGISHQAVSKRKWAVIQKLRTLIEVSKNEHFLVEKESFSRWPPYRGKRFSPEKRLGTRRSDAQAKNGISAEGRAHAGFLLNVAKPTFAGRSSPATGAP